MTKKLPGVITPLVILLIGLIVGIGATFAYFKVQSKNTSPNQPSLTSPSPLTSPRDDLSSEASAKDETANWKTYKSSDGKYSFKYPSKWYQKQDGNLVYISNEKPEAGADTPMDRPIDFGLLTISPGNYPTISEKDFFDPNNTIWPKGNLIGGGGGLTYSIPSEVKVSGKRAMKQISHPTEAYEASLPNHISDNYHVWLGTSYQVLNLSFTYDDRSSLRDDLVRTFNQILSTFQFLN